MTIFLYLQNCSKNEKIKELFALALLGWPSVGLLGSIQSYARWELLMILKHSIPHTEPPKPYKHAAATDTATASASPSEPSISGYPLPSTLTPISGHG
jgi:hypothetical protein